MKIVDVETILIGKPADFSEGLEGEFLVTPLHMLMLYNAVANNGTMMKPYLVNAVTEFGVDQKRIEPQVRSLRLNSFAMRITFRSASL